MDSVKDWPVQERPREKMAELGVSNLSDAELLAILLGTGIPGKDVVAYSRDLLQTFKGIGGMLSAPARDLLAQRGLGRRG